MSAEGPSAAHRQGTGEPGANPSAASPTTPAETGRAAGDFAVPGARHALLLLVLINLFNYIDRQVLAAVEPQIRRDFFPPKPDPVTGKLREPEEAKGLSGALAFAFLVTYMLTAPLFGSLATRTSRWLLIGLGVGVWSLASGASGLAPGFTVLLLTRCFVGLGEAVYGPVAPDVISDLFPVRKRGQVLAWFYAAIPFGGALGYALGAVVVKATDNWRPAFYLVVPPGLLLALWCLLMREPARGQADNVKAAPARRPSWYDYLFLLKTPSYLLNTAGMTAMTFAMGGLAWWAPGYLDFREAESVLGMPPVMFFGVLTAVLGLLATVAGGLAGDALRPRFPGSYFLVSGTAMCLAFPLLLLVVALDFPAAWVPLGLFVFCLFFNTGPTNTILANVCHPWLRARGFALNILLIHLLGDALSPSVMGVLIGNRDRYALAFQFVSVTVLVGGLLWLWGAQFLQRDTELAPTRLPDAPASAGG